MESTLRYVTVVNPFSINSTDSVDFGFTFKSKLIVFSIAEESFDSTFRRRQLAFGIQAVGGDSHANNF